MPKSADPPPPPLTEPCHRADCLRQLVAAESRAEDAEAALAVVVERAAKLYERHSQKTYPAFRAVVDETDVAAAIRALAPSAAVEHVQKMRAVVGCPR